MVSENHYLSDHSGCPRAVRTCIYLAMFNFHLSTRTLAQWPACLASDELPCNV